jgi:hypothetical protein
VAVLYVLLVWVFIAFVLLIGLGTIVAPGLDRPRSVLRFLAALVLTVGPLALAIMGHVNIAYPILCLFGLLLLQPSVDVLASGSLPKPEDDDEEGPFEGAPVPAIPSGPRPSRSARDAKEPPR